MGVLRCLLHLCVSFVCLVVHLEFDWFVIEGARKGVERECAEIDGVGGVIVAIVVVVGVGAVVVDDKVAIAVVVIVVIVDGSVGVVDDAVAVTVVGIVFVVGGRFFVVEGKSWVCWHKIGSEEVSMSRSVQGVDRYRVTSKGMRMERWGCMIVD